MSDVTHSIARVDFPATTFICALFKMSPEQRVKANAGRAAERYGLTEQFCEWWIGHARQTLDMWPIKGGR